MIGHALLGVVVGALTAAAASALLDAPAMCALGLYVAAGGTATFLSAITTAVGRGRGRPLPRGGVGTDRVIPPRSPRGR